jgi:hypothetical protein
MDARGSEADYTEMRPPAELRGSLNAIVSAAHKVRRPPALSESFAWTPENVERAQRQSASTQSLDLLVLPEAESRQTSPARPATPPLRSATEIAAVRMVLKLVFHITLISIFESVFFFLYVSDLENNGLQTTVAGFITDAVNVCANFTVVERDIANAVLNTYINASAVIAAGDAMTAARALQNAKLNVQSWIYVGALSGVFVATVFAAWARRVPIAWKSLLLENFAMVALLAVYEYMFFSTVIFPYAPLSGQEIARNAVEDLHAQCALF